MHAVLDFGQVRTLRVLVREHVLDGLCKAAELAATDFAANSRRVRDLLEDLAFELDAYDVSRFPIRGRAPAAAKHEA